MFMKHFIAGLALTLFTVTAMAQESAIYTNSLRDYQEALSLYNNKQYQASQAIFNKIKQSTTDLETKANCAYYIANCAVRLNQIGADQLMEDFVEEYPTSTKRNSAFIDVADYYFENGRYAHALKWYKKVDDANMARSEQDRFNFNMGYALFSSKKYNDAERYLNKVVDSEKYGSQAKYYIGYIAYQSDNYNQANEYFDEIANQDELNEKLSYYQADMNFKLGNFEKAIELAKAQLPKSDRREISELNKIIGESYFNLAQYNEAIPYLQEYKGKRGKWTNTDYYQLGYAYYKQDDYENAISQFNKIIDGNNAVAQNAYYHLAECYLKTDKKQQALNAFKNASDMDYNAQIQQDALLNYGRLSYEIGNPYESAPKVLASYLEKYPESQYKQEVQELLVDSYITSKNYEAALVLLENNRNYSTKTTYQKVAFYRGVELYNDGNYREASSFFDKALNAPEDPLFTARATYWKAETDYLANNFDDALVGYKQFVNNAMAPQTEEYNNINYNIGYAYFKLKDYTQAANYFDKYAGQKRSDEVRLNDTYLRLGDSHFVNSKYWPAMEAYNKAIAMKGPDTDYAYFQKSMSYGFVNRKKQKEDALKSFIRDYPKSKLRDDAMYELGNSYVSNNKTDLGLQEYDRLISSYRMSSYVPKALLKQGLIYYNAGTNERALTKFKTVVRDFPNSQEALQAVSTAKLIYVDEGRVNEYAAWVQDLDFVEVSDDELDNATFEAAERQYLQNKTEQAIRGFEGYVTQYPNGAHALKSHFYLGQLYYGKQEKNKAIPHYRFVVNKDRNGFTEQALARLSELYMDIKDFSSAIPLLQRLEAEADYPQNVTFAQSNLMKANYQLKDYQQTVAYAEKVLSNSKVDNRIKSDAQIMIARSAMQTGNEARAKTAYAEVQKIATGSLAAEALYYDAYFKHKNGDFETSNASVQKLAKDYAAYKEFGAKGLILMAKNFYELDDAFQATYILESVTKNFTEYPDIVAEAKLELTKIKAKEAKSNASVDPKDNN